MEINVYTVFFSYSIAITQDEECRRYFSSYISQLRIKTHMKRFQCMRNSSILSYEDIKCVHSLVFEIWLHDNFWNSLPYSLWHTNLTVTIVNTWILIYEQISIFIYFQQLMCSVSALDMVTTEILLQWASDPVFGCIIDQDGICDQYPIQERSPLVGYVINCRAVKNI